MAYIHFIGLIQGPEHSRHLCHFIYTGDCAHMGQFLQGGKNAHFVSYFFKKYSLRVTKPDKIDLIFQLILATWVLFTLETP